MRWIWQSDPSLIETYNVHDRRKHAATWTYNHVDVVIGHSIMPAAVELAKQYPKLSKSLIV